MATQPQSDWFAANAPAPQSASPPQGDWFAQNAPASTVQSAPSEPSNWDLYKEALFNPAGSGASAYPAPVEGALQIGGRALQALTAPILHPLKAIEGIGQLANETSGIGSAEGETGPIEKRLKEFGQEWQKSPALAVENAAGDVAGAVESGRIIAPAADAVINRVAIPLASRAVLLGKTPAEAYESALKPSTTLSQGERAEAVQTGLQNSIPVSKAGVEKISDLIDQYNQQIKNTIATDPNRPIDPNLVATRADIARAKFAKQVNAQPDLNAIEASRQQFLAEQGAKPGSPAVPPQLSLLRDAYDRPIMNAGEAAKPPTPAPPMNASDAQVMKQGTYSVLKGKYGELGSASVEAQKALARGLKEEIATQFPEIGKLNAAESRLLDLQPILERAVNRISNHQLIGIGTPVAGAAADAVAGPGAGRVAMVMKAVLDNPTVKSRLAISLSKGAKIPYAQAVARVAAYTSALGANVPDSQQYQAP